MSDKLTPAQRESIRQAIKAGLEAFRVEDVEAYVNRPLPGEDDADTTEDE